MKRIQLEPWTAFDKHCLTSAVSRVGDQNWTAVSRQTRNIYEDSIKWCAGGEKRSLEWFSNKQCAAQYEHLLKNVPPRRKKRTEKASDQGTVTESPAEILQQTCRHEFVEELKRTLVEEQAQYLKLLKEYEDILAGRLDHKLEDLQEEYEAKEREKEIKIKLKFKLGEKSLAESPTIADHDRPPPIDLPTTPLKPEKEGGPEQVKTSVTTSPLLTSLLQSPSPLTRPSSATPTISLLLNSSPSVPANESPTLSKLLETSCPTPTSSIQQSSMSSVSGASRSATTPVPSRPQVVPSTPLSASAVEPSITSVLPPAPPAVALDAHVKTSISDVIAPLAGLPVDLLQSGDEIVISSEGGTPSSASAEDQVHPDIPETVEKAADDKKRGLPRRLQLEDVEHEEEDTTESQVMETVEEIIEKVQSAIIETVGDNSGGDGSAQDLSNIAESETTTTEDHSLDTLELSTDAVQMIVVGPDREPNFEVNMKDDESKADTNEEIPDIDEIQPSLSASDIAQMEEPLKEDLSETHVEGGEKEPSLTETPSPQVTIEQAEADLASLTREEAEDDEDSLSQDKIILTKQAVVVVERVPDPDLDESLDEKSQEAEKAEVSREDEETRGSAEDKQEDRDAEIEKVEERDEVSSPPKDEAEEEESASEITKGESEDDTEQDSVTSRPLVEAEEVTTGTENTSDSYADKAILEDDTRDAKEDREESEGSEEEKKEEAKEEPERRPKAIDRSSAISDVRVDASDDDKVEEIRSGKRELRRGRATPPVTLSSDRSLREKRPLTPSSSSDGREEPTPRTAKRKRTTNVSESSVPCSPSPSIVSNDDDKEYKAWKKSILLVYDRIAAHKYASVFLKPINENDAPGYFQMIKCPTDLTTIKRQIESGAIRNTVDFQKEMLLMISNALIYNKSDTLVHKMAFEMLPDMKEAMETMVQALGSGVPLDQQDSKPPVTARVSRASVSATKGQSSDETSGTPSAAKRKRPPPPEDTRAKRKRSDAS